MNIKNRFQRRRVNLYNRDPHCYWCGIEVEGPIGPRDGVLRPNSATVDHLFPRGDPRRRGDKRFKEVTVLSCYSCNHDRGDTDFLKYSKEAMS